MKQKSISRIGSYSRALKINCRKPYILLLVLCGIGSFLIVVSGLFFGFTSYYTNDFLQEGPVFLAAATVLGAVMIPTLFRELYNRQFADVEFSLPMSSSERFLAKLLAVGRYHLLPLAVVLAALIIFSAVIGDSSVMIGMSISIITTAVYFDAVSMICVCCLGRLFESVYVPVVFATVLTLLPYVAFDRLVVAPSHHRIDTLQFFDLPFGVLSIMRIREENFSCFANYGGGFIIKHLVCLVIYAAAIALAYRIYRRRNAVQTGTPFVYRSFYIVFSFCVMVLLFMIFIYREAYIGIIFALAVYAAISISAARGAVTARTFIFTGETFFGTYLVTLALSFLAFVTGGFGFIDSVPGSWIEVPLEQQTRTVHPIEMQFDGFLEVGRDTSDYRRYTISMTTPNFDPEVVRTVFRTARKYAYIETSFEAYMDMINDSNNYNEPCFYCDVDRFEDLNYKNHSVFYNCTPENFEKLLEELNGIEGIEVAEEKIIDDSTGGEGTEEYASSDGK